MKNAKNFAFHSTSPQEVDDNNPSNGEIYVKNLNIEYAYD